MDVQYRYLFNFSASYSGGGLKRLHEYARWFGQHGGAWFIIHRRAAWLADAFLSNQYFVVEPSKYERLVDDCGYLPGIVSRLGRVDCYYAYGVPIYFRVGALNWFHLSNVLPLCSRGIPLSLPVRIKLGYLGRRIRRSYRNADVLSAESRWALGLIDVRDSRRLFLSVNGSDDELALEAQDFPVGPAPEKTAVAVGTFSYKALGDAYRVFEMLRKSDVDLKLVIVGDDALIPPRIRNAAGTVAAGILPRSEVIDRLRLAKYYISTTRIENSYNAASEGIFGAEQSYVSDIEPHRELLSGLPFERIPVPGVDTAMLHVKRSEMSRINLRTWGQVVAAMIARIRAGVPGGDEETTVVKGGTH